MRSRSIRRLVAAATIGSFAALVPLSAASAADVAPPPDTQEATTPSLDDLRDLAPERSLGLATVVSSKPLGSAKYATIAAGTTWQRTYTQTWKDAGVTLATHKATIAWTGDYNGYLYASPRSAKTDVSTALLISATNKSASWDWYTAGQGGTGQADSYCDIVLGIPTKWGNIGATQSSRIEVQVNGYGGAGWI